MTQKHLAHLREIMIQDSLDAILISSLPNIIYLTNFAHFSDLEREAYLLITKNSQYIFTDARYSHAVKTQLKNFQLLEISIQKSFIQHLKQLIHDQKIKKMGLEENNLTVAEHKKIISVFKNSLHINLRDLRIKKNPWEIKHLKKSCQIGDQAFTYICKQIKLGMTEKELVFKLETFIRQQGADIAFPTIVAFGKNAAIPHHKSGNEKLTANNFILLDFGVKYENCCSDMTRTIFFGKATNEQKKVYETVLTAQEKAMQQYSNLAKQSKPVKAANIDKAARDYIISKGYPSIPHSLGHGIGLQVHEAPSLSPGSKDILANGMVFSIEPGIYLNDNFGIRIEDLFAIENNKLIRLTKSPRDLIQI
ncbi:MAG TPA: aminopeptidase P family protein [Patescibacteria group bacterium]